MKTIKYFVYRTVIYLFLLMFFCEFLLYYLVQWQCNWPDLTSKSPDDPIKVMILADTHFLGSRNGHWFDKLRREWQMHRAFQTAMTLHQPELIFVLGDVTDEGLWCSEAEFQGYVERFYRLFAVPEGSKMSVVVGNHDIGFHYGISPYLNQRFVSAFDAPAVKLISVRGSHFVLLNSMALEGDGCFLCRSAEQQLQHIEARLKCTKGVGKCGPNMKLSKYSRPIVMQHFPLYRTSDAICSEPDSAPLTTRSQQFRERWDCLSREATAQILETLHPRLIFSGHTHFGCKRQLEHPEPAVEFTIASFNWRNHEAPSYTLGKITPEDFAVTRCEMPRENTVKMVYFLGALTFLGWLLLTWSRGPRRRARIFKLH